MPILTTSEKASYDKSVTYVKNMSLANISELLAVTGMKDGDRAQTSARITVLDGLGGDWIYYSDMALIKWNGIMEYGWMNSLYSLSTVAYDDYTATYRVASVAQLVSAFNQAKKGEVIEVADGIYSVDVILDGVNIVNGVTIVARNLNQATFTGSISITNATNIRFKGLSIPSSLGKSEAVYISETCTDITLSQCNFDAVASDRIIKSGNSGTSNAGNSAKRIIIEYCTFANRGHAIPTQIIQLWVSAKNDGSGNHLNVDEGHIIKYNLFKDLPSNGEGSEVLQMIGYQPAAEYTFGEDTNIEIHHNLFTQANGEAELMSIKCNGVHIYNNIINDCEGNISLRYGKRTKVYNNYMDGHNTRNAGINVADSHHQIYGNTIKRYIKHGIGLIHQDDTSFVNAYRPSHNCFLGFNTLYNNRYNISFDALGAAKAPDTAPNATVIVNNVLDKGIGANFWGNFKDSLTMPATNSAYDGNIYNGTLGVTSTSGLIAGIPEYSINNEGLFPPNSGGNLDSTSSGDYFQHAKDIYGLNNNFNKDKGALTKYNNDLRDLLPTESINIGVDAILLIS